MLVTSGTCTAVATASVEIAAPAVATATPATICSGQSASLTASGGANYLWSNGNTTSSINVSPASTTTYSVIVSVASCSDTAYTTLAVNPTPTVSLGNDQTICSGKNSTLDAANPGASYLWSTNATTQTISVSSQGNYWVIVARNNCLAKDTVSTFLSPKVHLFDSSLCTTTPILLDAGSGGSSYLWNTGSTDRSISVDQPSDYWVEVQYGSCQTSDTAKIGGEPGTGSLYVPNAFTPNDDNLNELFLAKGTGIISFDMKVFDRWGNLIFTSDDINKGWDGKIQGGHYVFKNDGTKTSQEDVYVWIVKYITKCYKIKENRMMGHVSLVR